MVAVWWNVNTRTESITFQSLFKYFLKHFLKHQTLPLMGATRPASGIKAKAHRQVCKKLSVSLYLVYEHSIFF